MVSKLRILVITPKFKIPGGVSEFNKMLLHYSSNELTPFFLSSVGYSGLRVLKPILILTDYFRFISLLMFKHFDVVHVNPSLGKNSILRDSVFVWFAKLFRKKVFIHWHGWNPKNEFLLEKYNEFLKKTLFKADHIKFLASSFQKKFKQKGYTNKSSLGNTFIDNKLLSFEKPRKLKNDAFNILFLSTISVNKGIYIALEAYKSIVKKNYNVKFTIAGTGVELDSVKQMVKKEQIPNVVFKGYVSGNNKSLVYAEADVYIFPSLYEGMPTSLIEAMGFGIPVVCSSVGAIPDFFQQNKMGYIIEDQIANDYSRAMEKLLIDKNQRIQISQFNKKYVNENFLATKTIENIDNDYSLLANNTNK